MAMATDRSTLERAEARRRPYATLLFLLRVTAPAAAFFLVQSLLALRQQSIEIEAIRRISGSAAAAQGVGSIVPEMVLSGARYLALLIGAVTLLLRGWRRAYVVPIALIALLTPAPGALPLLRHTLGTWPGLGSLLGLSADLTVAALWAAGVVDLVMLLLPAKVLSAKALSARGAPQPTPRFLQLIATRGIGVGAAALVIASLAIANAGTNLTPSSMLLRLAPLFLLGGMLRLDRQITVVMAAVVLLLSFDPGNPTLTGTTFRALPLFVSAMVGASASWIDRLIDRIGDSTAGLLVAVNLLNILDVVLTRVSIGRVGASELNPVVQQVGVLAKLGVVAVASVLVARLRPRLLIVAVVAFILLIVWQVAGLVSSAAVLGG